MFLNDNNRLIKMTTFKFLIPGEIFNLKQATSVIVLEQIFPDVYVFILAFTSRNNTNVKTWELLLLHISMYQSNFC